MNDPKPPDKRELFTPAVRKGIYGVIATGLSLAVALGLITEELVPLVLTGVAGVLGLGLAYKHVYPSK